MPSWVIWYGGEPLLRASVVVRLAKEIGSIAEAHQIELRQRVITNGTLLTLDCLRELVDAGIEGVQITLDSLREVHNRRRVTRSAKGTFDKVLSGIKCAIGNVRVAVRVNLDKDILDSLPAFLSFLSAEGILDKVEVNPAMVMIYPQTTAVCADAYSADRCFSPDEFASAHVTYSSVPLGDGQPFELFRPDRNVVPHPQQCSAVRPFDLVVGPRGDVWKCPVESGDPDKVVGSILDANSLSLKSEGYRSYVGSDPFRDTHCVDCAFFPICLGGCPMMRMTFNDRSKWCAFACRFCRHYVEKMVSDSRYESESLDSHPLLPIGTSVPYFLQNKLQGGDTFETERSKSY